MFDWLVALVASVLFIGAAWFDGTLTPVMALLIAVAAFLFVGGIHFAEK